MAMNEQLRIMAQRIVIWALNGSGIPFEEAEKQVGMMTDSELHAAARKHAKAYFTVDANDIDPVDDDEEERNESEDE